MDSKRRSQIFYFYYRISQENPLLTARNRTFCFALRATSTIFKFLLLICEQSWTICIFRYKKKTPLLFRMKSLRSKCYEFEELVDVEAAIAAIVAAMIACCAWTINSTEGIVLRKPIPFNTCCLAKSRSTSSSISVPG